MDIDHGQAICSDCGQDAYIRLAGNAAVETFVCARCFGVRGRKGGERAAGGSRMSTEAQPVAAAGGTPDERGAAGG